MCGPSGQQLTKNLGVDNVLDYTQNWQAGAKNIDVVLDCVGQIKKKDCLDFLNKNGKFLTVGGMDVAKETVGQLQLLAQLFDAEKLNSTIDKTFEFDEMQAAHTYVDSGRKKGNVVVRI